MRKYYISALLLFASVCFAQTADEIIARADEKFTGDRIWSYSTMTIIRGGKTLPVQEMESFSRDTGGDYMSLSVYREPARMKGTAYLMIGDDLWVRFSSTGRIRKLSSSAKKNAAGGSDFSYADMGEGSEGIGKKYDLELAGTEEVEGEECFAVEMIPKRGEDSPYERVIAYVSKSTDRYLKMIYYEAGAPIKQMTLTDYRTVGDREYPFYIEMKSLTKDSVTIMETSDMEFGSSRVQDRFFSAAYLQTIH